MVYWAPAVMFFGCTRKRKRLQTVQPTKLQINVTNVSHFTKEIAKQVRKSASGSAAVLIQRPTLTWEDGRGSVMRALCRPISKCTHCAARASGTTHSLTAVIRGEFFPRGETHFTPFSSLPGCCRSLISTTPSPPLPALSPDSAGHAVFHQQTGKYSISIPAWTVSL